MLRKRVRSGVVEDDGGMVDGSRGTWDGNLMGVGGETSRFSTGWVVVVVAVAAMG